MTNGYSSRRRRREILGFGIGMSLENLEDYHKRSRNESQMKNDHLFLCKCGRKNSEHPIMTVGDHYNSLPYHGDLCPYVTIGEFIK